MPFSAYYMTEDGQLQTRINEEQLRAAVETKQGLVWVDVGDTTVEDGNFLTRVFNFHPLAVEDCVDPAIHTPKVDEYDEYLFLTFRGIDYAAEGDILSTTELNVFLGPHYVVSNHNFYLHSIESVTRLVEVDGRPLSHGPAFLAHALVDALVDNILPTIDLLSERADDIEDEIIRNPGDSTLRALMALKSSSLRLRRAMVPQREVLSRLTRREFGQVSEDARLYFRDTHDNMIRIESVTDNLRERADTALAMYLSSLANRQNETMKVLSAVAAIFLPLTLVAGIYGMNFDNMPELHRPWGYFAVLGFMGVVIALTLWWFWARRWFTLGRKSLAKFVPTAVDRAKLLRYVGHVSPRRHN